MRIVVISLGIGISFYAESFLLISFGTGKEMVKGRLLFVADGGFDSKDLLYLLDDREKTDFIIKQLKVHGFRCNLYRLFAPINR